MAQRLPNYLKTHRKRSGLTQREIAFLLGNSDGAQLSRYEKHRRVPPLETALAFEAIFKTPVAELFAGLRDSAASSVKERAHAFGLELQKRNSMDSVVMRKLRFMSERGSLDQRQDAISCKH